MKALDGGKQQTPSALASAPAPAPGPGPGPAPAVPSRINVTAAHSEAGNPLSDFMVPAVDSHGHSARVQVRLPPSMKHQIELMVKLGKFPFQTESDFGRVAFFRLLKDLTKLTHDGNINNMQSMLNAMVSAARIQQEHSHFAAVLDQVGKTVADLLSRAAHPAARKLLSEVAKQIENIDDPYWHDRYKKDLIDRFAHVLHHPAPKAAK